MQSILVPTDFSPNAYNAAQYAIALAKDLNATKIILYNAYQPYVSEDPELGLPLQTDMQEFKELSETGLEKMQHALQPELSSSLITLETESDYNVITNGILDACKKYDAGLIIMGISGAENKVEEVIFGSNAIDVSKHSQLPVIIVPANAKYTGLKKALLAADLKKSAETTPVAEIKKLLDATGAQLDILHIEANETNDINLEKEQSILNSLFANYNAQFHFLQSKVFTDAINQFALEHQSDLIIVIPKKHGLFEGIFKRSHAKALAFHSKIPIMCVHE